MKLQYVFWLMVVGLTAYYISDLWTEACWDAEYAEKLESRREPEGGIIIIGDEDVYDGPVTDVVFIEDAKIVSTDPNAIRRLAENGKVCEVMGHQWYYDETWVVLRCKLCSSIRSFQLKIEKQEVPK